jgi:PAS domain-containing protein
MQGKAAIGFTHPEDRDRGRALLEAAVQGQTVLDFQQRVLCADGGFRWLQCNCVPLPEQNLLVVIARDTTEEHAHSEELCRLNAELETRVAERTAALQEQVRLLEERERSLRLAEKQLGDALELAGFAHWSYDLDSEEVVFNDRMYAQLRTDAAREGGYRLDLERARTRFMAPEMAESMRGVLKEAIAGEDGAPRDLCIQVRLGDGSMGEISARIMVQADGSGRWRRVYGIGRVTPHLQA